MLVYEEFSVSVDFKIPRLLLIKFMRMKLLLWNLEIISLYSVFFYLVCLIK